MPEEIEADRSRIAQWVRHLTYEGGKIDAFSNVIQVPSSHVTDAGTTRTELNLLPMTKAGQKKVQ